jgi:Carbohydrate-binding module 48 (Isoamylase N-terminal domain)/Alpha amylase, catalytic domain
MSVILEQAVVENMSAAANRADSTGRSYPLGATVFPDGVNFSIFSRGASAVELLLFDREDDARPSRVISIDSAANRTYHYWHAFVSGLRPGQIYGYRVHGPWNPANGMRFDPAKLLLDPYGRSVIVPKNYSREPIRNNNENTAAAMKSVVVDPQAYAWEGDATLKRPFSRTIIYEMHVRGFTRHPSSDVADEIRGTYAGLIEKIPYLQELGITAVELLPVFQFDAQDAPLGQVNYWGYAPVSFFAPHQGYSSRRDPLGAVNEFRDMVKALHRAGIEVILDVVFNHLFIRTVDMAKKTAQKPVSVSPAVTPDTPRRKSVSQVPATELMSFLKQTRGTQTWTEKDLAAALKIGFPEAKEVIAALQLQGYIEPAGHSGKWRITEEGDVVSGAKAPRFTRQSVEKALDELKERIKAVNEDPNADYKIMDAVVFGDFLGDAARVQAAEVGVRLTPKKDEPLTASAKAHRAEVASLKRLRGRTALLHVTPFEDWMRSRSHRDLL